MKVVWKVFYFIFLASYCSAEEIKLLLNTEIPDEINGDQYNSTNIQWATVPCTGRLSDFYIYTGAFNHPRNLKKYIPLFDGILIENNMALTNVMFDSIILTQIQEVRSEGFTVINAVNYHEVQDIQKNIRYIDYAYNYENLLNDIYNTEAFQHIPFRTDGVQLALIKLNQSYNINVQIQLIQRQLDPTDDCVVLTRFMSEIKALPINIHSKKECQEQLPQYEERTCFSYQNTNNHVRPGAPIFCSSLLGGIVRWTNSYSYSKLHPYADLYKYHKWIFQTSNTMQKRSFQFKNSPIPSIQNSVKTINFRPGSLFYLLFYYSVM